MAYLQCAVNLPHNFFIITSYNILKDILVAIDPGTETAPVIQQVIELTRGKENITVHLLHVCQTHNKSRWHNGTETGSDPQQAAAMETLQQCRLLLQQSTAANNVKGYLLKGRLQQRALDVARVIRPQLIITAAPVKKSCFGLCTTFNADQLSRRSTCPVLNLANHQQHSCMKRIILPVRDFIPVRKMELLVLFARLYKAKVVLVAKQNSFFKSEKERDALLESYRILRNGLSNRVECCLLKGNNFPKAIAAYAGETGADMLIANPGKETLVSGIFNMLVTDILPAGSQLKVLFVVPYQDM